MTIARQQGTPVNVAVQAGGTLTPALTGIGAGNTLICSVVNTTQTSGQAASAVSGAGATWSLGVTLAAAIGVLDIWYGRNASGSGGSQTVTVTLNGASPTAGCQLDEFSGVRGVSPLEQGPTNSGTSTAPSLAITPKNPNDLLYVLTDAAVETGSPTSPWNALTGPTTAGSQKNGIAWQVVSSLSTQTATWTTASAAWTTVGIVLTPAVFGPAVVVRQAVLGRPYVGRQVPQTPIVQPVSGLSPFPPAIVVTQSRRRPYVGRTIPLPHLARPVVAPGGPTFPSTYRWQVYDNAFRLNAFWVRGRSSALPPHLARPVVAPGRAVVPVATIIGDAGRYRVQIGRRGYLHLAGPNLAPLPFPPAVVVRQARARPYVGRTAPKPHVVGPVLAVSALAPFPLVVTQARPRTLIGRTVPKPHFTPPVISPSAPVVPPATMANATVKGRVLIGRRGYLHVAPPNLSPAPFPPAVVRQALRRALVGRTTPKPHLAPPSLAPSPFPPALTVTHQSWRRAFVGRTTPRPHLASPLVGAGSPVVPGATIVTDQALGRPYVGRQVPQTPIVQPIVGGATTAAPLAPAVVVSQALRRPPRGFSPRLIGPIVAPGGPVGFPVALTTTDRVLGSFWQGAGRWAVIRRPVVIPNLTAPPPPPVPPAVVVAQALRRPLVGRTTPRPHLARPVVSPGTPVSPGATVVDDTVRARPLIGRRGYLHLPPPTLAPSPFQPALVISQARRRPLLGRTIPKPHLAPANLAPSPFRPTVEVDQARARALVGRSTFRPHLAPANLTPSTAPPVPPGLFVYQATKRPLIGRRLQPLHLAPPVVAPGRPVVPSATVVRRRNRFPLPVKPHLASPVVASPVVAGATIVKRLNRFPAPPHPHLAPPIVSPGGAVLIVALPRERLPYGFLHPRQAVPRPHLAGANLSPPPFPPTVLVAQARQRALTRRGAPAPHHATPLVTPVPLPPAVVVVTQARQRALIGRTPPRPHHASPVIPPFFIAPKATQIDQAIARAQIVRSGPRPRLLAPPNLSPIPFPPAKVLSQALARPYVGRTPPPHPHLAPSVPPPPPPPPGLWTVGPLTDPWVLGPLDDWWSVGRLSDPWVLGPLGEFGTP